jgi:hypothetical protein
MIKVLNPLGEKINQGVGLPHGSILGPFFFLIYINGLPKLASIGTEILLYTDDYSIIVTSPNFENFNKQIDKIFRNINNCFKINQLVLNYNKTHDLQFSMKNSMDYALKLIYQDNYVKRSSHTKFLELIIDDSLLWKAYIDHIMSKLNTACFVIQMLQVTMYIETLRMVFFAKVHSIKAFGIIFGGTNHIVRRFSNAKNE